MRRWRRWLRREKVDPNRLHPFVSTNDGYRVNYGGPSTSNTQVVPALSVTRVDAELDRGANAADVEFNSTSVRPVRPGDWPAGTPGG